MTTRTALSLSLLFALGCGLGRVMEDPELAALELSCGSPDGGWRPAGEDLPSVACYELGMRASRAKPPDPALARAYLQRACDLELATACHNLAVLTEQGAGGPSNADAAAESYARACTLGHAASCPPAAEDLLARTPPQTARARALLERGCDLDDASACLRLGNLHNAGTPTDDEAFLATEAWRRACVLGSDAGCFNLAVSEKTGRGTALDPVAALDRFLSLCLRSVDRACSQAGELIWQGADVPGGDDEALALFERGCAQGEAIACLRLGEAHAQGRGRPVDPARAAALRQQACTLGYGPACAD